MDPKQQPIQPQQTSDQLEQNVDQSINESASPLSSPQYAGQQQPVSGEESDKSYVVAVLVSYFVGSLGVDRFYLGHIGTGIAKLFTLGGFGLWQLVDFIMILFGKLRAKGDDRQLQGFAQNNKLMKIIFLIMLALQAVIVIGVMAALVTTTFTGVQGKVRDTERQTDIKALHGQIESFYAKKGTYPSLKELNEASFRSSNLSTLDLEAFKDPQGSSDQLIDTPKLSSSYGYQAAPSGCSSSSTPCLTYQLGAYLEDGQLYTKNNLN